jgi:hypothetical protein
MIELCLLLFSCLVDPQTVLLTLGQWRAPLFYGL